MFVDASALVAILCREPGHEPLIDCLDHAGHHPVTSPLVIFETATAISRKRGFSVDAAEAEVRSFLATAGITVMPIVDEEAMWAIRAFARYGKGSGHPAQLNMGDCFAYACARSRDLPLLFVGNDFSQTDIPSAMA